MRGVAGALGVRISNVVVVGAVAFSAWLSDKGNAHKESPNKTALKNLRFMETTFLQDEV